MAIAPGAWREVALSDAEYDQIVELLGREPTPVELGMFGAMWSEHCGYKHSRPLLRTLPTTAPWVVQGPGENAGAVYIGEGLALVFKVESHNHPSAVEPYEGAATGVGGIVRDIFTMGARPIALLNALRFGPLTEPRNHYLYDNVVAGIGGYGNCLGIPTVGGEVFFHPAYNGNPLVNAMCVGIVERDKLVRARASGVGNLLMLIGADTGRDGLHGATFASVDDPEASHRGVVQVGNPFLEKLLLEACLELLGNEHIVAMQDLGAAGLTSSVVETTTRGGVGSELDVAHVPRRETGMTPYEVMLSESQERMLLVVQPDGADQVRTVVERWGLHAAVVGRVTDDGHVRVVDGDEVVVNVPGPLFTDACPTYVREAVESPDTVAARAFDPLTLPDLSVSDDFGSTGEALRTLLGSLNIGSRRPVFERYDHTILTNTVVPPGDADAAVLRIRGTQLGVAFSLDCNSRYCYLDPRLGARHAVAEAARNVACVGARPLGATNCLNFGNPERPAGYYQLRESVAGIGDACEALNIPIVSGNVSLYNETAETAVLPTPIVGVVGVLDDVRQHATMRWNMGDDVWLLGAGNPTLGGGEYLSTVHNRTAGSPPPLDFATERRLTDLILELIQNGIITCAHDVGLGGLAVALTEMAMISGIGVSVPDLGRDQTPHVATRWFGESATRVIVATNPLDNERLLSQAVAVNVPARRLGQATGVHLELEDVRWSVSELSTIWENALP